jgi:hypothetical protein
MACACNKAKGNWKVYSAGGAVIYSYGPDDSSEVKAKAKAKTISGAYAKRG